MSDWSTEGFLGKALLLLVLLFLSYELTHRAALMRLFFKEVLRLFILTELAVNRLMRIIIPPRYEVVGQCNQRGDCCTMILGVPPSFVHRSKILTNLFLAYHRVLHNFTPVGRGPEDAYIFACGHLQTDGRCGIYRYRPFICRNYPVRPYFHAPPILPGCSYQVRPRVLRDVKERPSLRILNPRVAVHHSTRLGGREREEQSEDFEMVALCESHVIADGSGEKHD